MRDDLVTAQHELSERPFLVRGTERAMAKLQRRTALEMAHIAQVAAVQVTRVEAVGCVAQRGLFEVALVSQAEQSLALVVPLASGRLQTIADVAALGIAEIVADTVRLVTR